MGLVINTKKSFLIPQQSTEFLGFLIKSVTLQIQMPQEKLRKIQQDARGLLLHQSVTVRDLARFVGKTTASCKAIWQAPLHYRGIQALMNSVSPEAEDNPALTGRFNIRLPLSEEAQQDLLWWVSLDRTVPLQAPPSTKSSQNDHNFRCLLGGLFGGHNYRGDMVGTGDDAPHQLFRTSSCLPGSTMFSEDREQYNHSSEVGQRDSSHLHQLVGRNSLQTFVPTSTCLLGMVHSEELVSDCRTSSGSAECPGRPRIQEPEGSMRLDDQPPTVSRSVGPLSGRSICFSPDLAATQVLQLENRSGGRGSGCIQTGLVTLQGVCQSPLVFNPLLPQSSSCSEGQADTINPSVAIPSVVPSGVGDVGGHTSTAPKSREPRLSPPRAGVSNAPGMPQPGCMAYLRESFSSRGVSTEASALLLSSWRPKTQSSYNSAFAKWASWCHERNRDPTFGPIEDVVNFLSEFFSKGYQYRSLNSYRSAISAVHRKVDGYSVGQHPLVSRLLKGAFNERPPLFRYSSFWNVDVVMGPYL